jgi:signal peptidase II
MVEFEKAESRITKAAGMAERHSGFAVPRLEAQLIFWTLAGAGTALDLWSKNAIFAWLEHRGQESFSIVDGFFQLISVENAGAAFGIAYGQRHLLTVVSGLAVIAIVAVFFLSRNQSRLVHVALGLFAAGVCGNLYDRIFNAGRVRDFLDVYWGDKHWPAFNAADTMLCIAVGLLVLSSILTERSCRKRGQQRK